MTDIKSIVLALEQMGVPKNKIEVAQERRLTLSGYNGQSCEVDLCVERAFHEGYGDFGFLLSSDNNYDIVVDDMDNVGRLAVRLGVKNFSTSVKQWYSAVKAKKALRNQGLSAKINRDGDRLVVVAQG
jgi:hypothetical protein